MMLQRCYEWQAWEMAIQPYYLSIFPEGRKLAEKIRIHIKKLLHSGCFQPGNEADDFIHHGFTFFKRNQVSFIFKGFYFQPFFWDFLS